MPFGYADELCDEPPAIGVLPLHIIHLKIPSIDLIEMKLHLIDGLEAKGTFLQFVEKQGEVIW